MHGGHAAVRALIIAQSDVMAVDFFPIAARIALSSMSNSIAIP